MRPLRLYATSVLLVGAVAAAEATTAITLSTLALTEGAEVIATGRCTGLRTVWEGRTLVTVATVAVDDVLKGEPGATLTVALPGGSDANRAVPVAMTFAGAPQMTIGEDVFLFLNRDTDVQSGLVVMGFSQGKFSIVADAAGQPVVSRDLTRLTLQSPTGTQRGTASRMPLDAFKREIREYLSRR
jgi:hypothetical protein